MEKRVLRRQNLNLWEICGQSTVDRSHNNEDKPGVREMQIHRHSACLLFHSYKSWR